MEDKWVLFEATVVDTMGATIKRADGVQREVTHLKAEHQKLQEHLNNLKETSQK